MVLKKNQVLTSAGVAAVPLKARIVPHRHRHVGFAIFLMNQTTAMIYVWFVIYGVAQGIGMGIMAPMRARYFGRKSFGSIAGVSRLFMTPIGIAAPIYLGWVYDTTHSYISAFVIIAGLVAASGVMALFVMPPKPPAQIGEVGRIM